MIRKILTSYAERLNEYLSTFHHRPEGLAAAGPIGNAAEERPNKMMLCLLNVERETTGGISAPMQRRKDDYIRMQPPLLLNLNVMLAAVYDERLYAESLSVLTDTLSFIQSTPKFRVAGTDYTIEIVTLSTQDMNNVWTLMGGQYYPSVVCKIRRLTLESEEITSGGSVADKTIVEM
ncbi:MAG: DUF4255 domain-containing protein [Parabacteroides sp.]|nr:DUF4255 domain-containing protein [Parabacteroides sp.]